MATSKLFTRIYRTLPPEQQRSLVEDQLAPLLDVVTSKKRDRVFRAVKRAQAHCDGTPRLDLTDKKREMQTLMMMLMKDDKVAFTKERSNREEILQEAVHSISSWLNKIWLMVYEYRVNYHQAHDCLIYALKSLAMLEDSPGIGDCKCLLNNMFLTVALQDKQRRTVKCFSFIGPRKLERPCLWIWRDLFLSMLVQDHRSKSRVQEMLVDIEEILGWPGLEQLLYGGKRSVGEDDDDYFDDVGEGDYSDEEEELLRDYEEGAHTDDEYDFGCDEDNPCCCRFHAKYWSDEINEERITLQDIIRTRLLDIFREAPEASLFNAIRSITQDSTTQTTKQMLDIVSNVAEHSADALKTALIIHTDLYRPYKILKLLEAHYHHLRPSDCPILLRAVATLANSSCRPQALKFIEKELLDAVQHICIAVHSAFFHFTEEINKADLAEILTLATSSPPRASRIERWVDRTLTPASEPVNPMTFAAMMMGFPVGPPTSSLDETDLLAYVDLNKPDPDLDGLREEFKPHLKLRFETWNLFAQSMAKDCGLIIQRVYVRIVELMPFFRSADIVVAMTNRLAEKPSKQYIHDAMLNVSEFCRNHRKKFAQHTNQRPRLKKTAPKSTMANTTQPAAAPAGSNTSSSTSASATASDSTSAAATPSPPAPTATAATATPPPPAAATGPIFHIFGSNYGAGPITSIFGHPLPNPINLTPSPTNGQNSPLPNPGNAGSVPTLPPPPECNHQ